MPTAISATPRRPGKALDEYLDEHQWRRQGNKILHGYPPPLLWRDRSLPLPEVMELMRDSHRRIPKRLNLYVGTPYCLPTEPDRCGFCIFPSEIYRDRAQLDDYLDSLELEGEQYREYLEHVELESIYFGGGTANLYLADQYERLLDIVRGVFGAIPPRVEVTLEGIPQLFSRPKLGAMQAAGINRISIGAQQLSDELIALSGRKQTVSQVFRAIEWCQELDLACSVDLIFGWPRQTPDRMLADLEAIARSGVTHLTHYELNVAGRTPFALELRDELPSRQENLLMYREAKQFLEQAGYRQRTAYDWEKADSTRAEYRYEQEWHRPLRCDAAGRRSGLDMWGWGYAGVSCFLGTPEEPGWTYLNCTRVGEYLDSLAAGRYPIERGYRYGARDLRLNVLFQMLQGMSVDLGEYRRLFGLDLLEEHSLACGALARRGWIAVDDGRLDLVGDGVFHTALIQSALANAEILRARPRRLDAAARGD